MTRDISMNSRLGRASSPELAELALRYLVILCLCFWMGGFTFYAGVVIHVGHTVFGSHREVGFLTQAVTVWLNRTAVIALLILIVNQIYYARHQSSKLRFFTVLALCLMIGIQVALFALHPQLDVLLDGTKKAILSRSTFRPWHKIYMNLSTVQWSAALLYLLATLMTWASLDKSSGRSNGLDTGMVGT